MNQKRRLLIVGGGSSGWIAAAYLNSALKALKTVFDVEITLVESPDIPRISVGEATIPSIRHLLATIGIDEADFMIATDASFKQSIRYVNWEKLNSFYHHPFTRVRKQPLDNSAEEWLKSDRSIPFMETCSEQPIICEMGLAPVMYSQWDMGAPLSHAYHMNAQKFADYLRDISVSRGVKHILANVTDVEMKSGKHIKAVNTDSVGRLEADLFIDCTGFRAKLIEEKLGVGFEDCSQWLLCDRAVAMHVPYDKYYPGMVRPYTTATALSNGWVWDIPMQSQRSLGYVHSSAFISKEAAERELRAYQGGNCDELPTRFVDFKVGRRHKVWEGNCIAIGLSGGFIEPLESTGLFLSDTGVVMLAEHFPFDESLIDDMSFRYNRILSNRFYEILDFINMHYCLTRRTDTEFWRTVQKPEHITDRLKAKLDFWKIKSPSPLDFEDQNFMRGYSNGHILLGGDTRPPTDNAGLWSYLSYQSILYGMKFEEQMYQANAYPQLPPVVHPVVKRRLEVAKNILPTHEKWLQSSLNMSEYPISNFPEGWV